MDKFIDILTVVYREFIEPLTERALVFFTPSDGLYIGYLLTASFIAIIYFAWFLRTWNVITAAKAAVRAHRFTSRSVVDDIKLFFCDKVLLGFVYTFVIGAAYFFKHKTILLLSLFDVPASHSVPGFYLSMLLTVGALLAFDFAVFFEHYLSHKVMILWEFHKIHHIAEELNPLTAYRSHPVNQCCFILMASLCSGVYSGVISYFFDTTHAYLFFAGQNIIMFLLLLFGLNLQHSRVFIYYPPVLRRIFVSPAYHQLHHSSDKKHHDINFGFIFSFWDYLFKVQYLPTKHEQLTFGVSGERYESYAGIKNTYVTPFRRAYKRIVKRGQRYKKSPPKQDLI